MREKERTLIGADGQFKITHEIEATAKLLNGSVIEGVFGILNTADVDVIIGCDIQKDLGPVTVDVKAGSVRDRNGVVLLTKEPKETDKNRNNQPKLEIPESIFEGAQINDKQKRMIHDLLLEYTDIMVTPNTQAVCASVQATIPSIEGSMPFCSVKPYPIPPNQRERAQKVIDGWLEQGIIETTQSSYNAPVLCVEKKLKPGQVVPDLRVCLDFRKLNKTIAPDPCIEESLQDILREIEDHKFRSVFDMPQAYLQIPLKKEDRHKTAFFFLGKQFQFKVAPFGLSISGSAFVRQMKKVTSPLDRRQVKSYVDDVLITSRTFEEHLRCIKDFMDSVRNNGMMLSFEKMQLCQKEVLFLGYSLTEEGFKINPKKLDGINDMGEPGSKADVRKLLGFVGFWRNFIPALSEITKGLTDSLSEKNWTLTDEMKREFAEIKRVMNSEPVCSYPRLGDPNCPFILYCDASHHTAAYALCQERDNEMKLIANGAMKFDSSKMHLCIFEKELWAVKWALKREKYLLKGAKFILKIDSQAVANVIQPKGKEMREYPNDKVARWVMSIFNFQFELEKIKTEDNILADALSRLPRKSENVESKANNESTENLLLLTKCYNLYDDDNKKHGAVLLTRDKIDSKVSTKRQHNWEKLFKFVHDQHGHQGFDRCLKLLRNLVDDIPNDRGLLRHYIQSCQHCLYHNSYTGSGNHGNISDYVRPTRPMQRVQVDIHSMEKASVSGYKNILGVVDEYSWFGRFYPLKTKTAKECASRIEEFLQREGAAVEVIKTDRGREFLGEFRALLTHYNVVVDEGTAYHKNKNVIVERSFSTIKGLIKASENPERWVTYLPYANILYNAFPHGKTGISPYQVVYGHPCRRGKVMVDSLSREQINAIINEKWEDLARETHKEPRRSYEIGKEILVRRPPKTNSGLCDKYGQQYHGPFKIIERVNASTYKINMLGKEIKVHLSQMKPYIERDLGLIRGGEEDDIHEEVEVTEKEEGKTNIESKSEITQSNSHEETTGTENNEVYSTKSEPEGMDENTDIETKPEMDVTDDRVQKHENEDDEYHSIDTLGKLTEIETAHVKDEESKIENVTPPGSIDEETYDTDELIKNFSERSKSLRKRMEESSLDEQKIALESTNGANEKDGLPKPLVTNEKIEPAITSSTPCYPRVRKLKDTRVQYSPIIQTRDENGFDGEETMEDYVQKAMNALPKRKRNPPQRLQIESTKGKSYKSD